MFYLLSFKKHIYQISFLLLDKAHLKEKFKLYQIIQNILSLNINLKLKIFSTKVDIKFDLSYIFLYTFSFNYYILQLTNNFY